MSNNSNIRTDTEHRTQELCLLVPEGRIKTQPLLLIQRVWKASLSLRQLMQATPVPSGKGWTGV